jgi:hypothetical protein
MIAAAGGDGASGDRQRSVVVAVIAVRMMQMTIDQVVDVITVRHHFVAAIGPVHMPRRMTCAAVLRRAAIRVAGTDGNHVLIDMVAMHVMQMAVMQEIDVAVVTHRSVTTLRTVLVVVLGMLAAAGHRRSPVSGCMDTIDRNAASAASAVTPGHRP